MISRKLFPIWIGWIALLLGAIEAMAFYKRDSEGYLILYTLFGISLLVVIPAISNRSEDWYLAIGGMFLIQLLQDWGHWIGRAVLVRNWEISDGFWTPLWNVIGVDMPIPLFWIIDICMFLGFYKLWRKQLG